jgi:hypothetical protein
LPGDYRGELPCAIHRLQHPLVATPRTVLVKQSPMPWGQEAASKDRSRQL